MRWPTSFHITFKNNILELLKKMK